MTSRQARSRVLGLVGLGLRGRHAVVGVQQVREAAKKGRLKVALVAHDASQNSLDKISGLLAAREVAVIRDFSAGELGAIAGREAVAVVGVTNAGLAQGIISAIPVAGSEAEVESESGRQGGAAGRTAPRRNSRRQG